uniref:Hexosyltransferase n=1 Tax=Nicotiana tabacum TaxID=4097 RepID=A0A1S4DQX1_TOBAC|nr:PREDICTED: probable galacturonosyltransferase 7 isoform X4 [Nicotiana tabacum]
MKGGIGGALPAKRRWKGFVIAVLGLVLLSLLVPLVFLLGLHNGFHSSGLTTAQQSSTSNGVRVYSRHSTAKNGNQSEGDESRHMDDLMRRLEPTFSKDIRENFVGEAENKTAGSPLLDGLPKERSRANVLLLCMLPLRISKALTALLCWMGCPKNAQEQMIDQKLTKMEAVIAQAKACRVDCSNVDKKFRQLVDLTEDEATFHMRQSAFLYQLAVQTMPKSHHCLSMRLTVEYFRDPSPDIDQSLAERHLNPDLHHFVIFSNNVLASSAVINSTVMHAKESESQVFHVVTDRQNYFAMKLWFSRNKYMEATVEVLNIEDVKLDNNKASTPIHLSLPDEYRVSFHKVDRPSTTEYLSVFSHSHYLLPQIFHSLKKVVVLDDDVIVQRDLSDLWGIDMDGKVNGAVQSCSVRLAQLRKFFGNKRVDETSCAWMSGLNVVDLVRWREQDISGRYLKLVKEMNSEEAVTLRASLLTFQGEVYALDDKWVLSGLGHKYGVDIEAVKNARVLHFNGKMKPWLELGIHDYTVFWRKFVDPENQFLSDCNIN